jgi:F-type H+-transporting ATPase subunit alpha
MPVEEQVVSIFAGVNGFLDTVPVNAVTRFESGLLAHVRSDHAGVLGKIRDTKTLDDGTAGELKTIIADFASRSADGLGEEGDTGLCSAGSGPRHLPHLGLR